MCLYLCFSAFLFIFLSPSLSLPFLIYLFLPLSLSFLWLFVSIYFSVNLLSLSLGLSWTFRFCLCFYLYLCPTVCLNLSSVLEFLRRLFSIYITSLKTPPKLIHYFTHVIMPEAQAKFQTAVATGTFVRKNLKHFRKLKGGYYSSQTYKFLFFDQFRSIMRQIRTEAHVYILQVVQ